MFGEYLKELRLGKNQTLRGFCLEHKLDPGNYSKLERGILPAPKDESKLKELAVSLGLRKGSLNWQRFFDLAFISKGKIPADILDDPEILNKLPLFFRTIKGEKISAEKLDKLIELIKES